MRNRPSACVARLIVTVLLLDADAAMSAGTFAANGRDLKQRIAAAGVPFVPNAGQWDERVAFAARTLAATMFVTTDGRLVYSLPGRLQADATPLSARDNDAIAFGRHGAAALRAERGPGWGLTETFVGEGDAVATAPRGVHPHAAQVGYFIGADPAAHQPQLDTFDRIDLGEVFKGINVELRATGGNVEKIFTVAPNAEPAQIRLRIDGATRLELGERGELIAHTGNGPVAFTAPVAWQEDSGGRREAVPLRYALDTTGHSYRFDVAAYDSSRALVIDPLLQSTYLGTGSDDDIYAMAIHPVTGDVYVAGATNATTSTFPGVSGGWQGTTGGGTDVFISRFNAGLTTLIKSTYLGAAGGEIAYALAIHPLNGDVYVAGATNSPGGTFPGSVFGAQTTFGGTVDVFVSRLTADLTSLIRSTYLGGAAEDELTALAIHPQTGDVYVAGWTDTTAGDFPGVAGGAQSQAGGLTDAFVSRFGAGLTQLINSTYVGGTGADVATSMAIHPASGEIYVAGNTSPGPDPSFPGVIGGAQSVRSGSSDAFVSRLTADLVFLQQSTYLGGTGAENAFAIAVHPASGDVYVAGFTDSPGSSFPGSASGGQNSYGGGYSDAFVSRLSSDLTALLRSSYFGGSSLESLRGLAIHPASGEIYIAGPTSSNAMPQSSGGAQETFGGATDAYVARFRSDLSELLQSTYLGTPDQEFPYALGIHPSTGEIYIAGTTDAPASTFPGVTGGAQSVFGGNVDGFISRISPDLTLLDTTPNAFGFAPQNNVPVASVRTSEPVQINGLGHFTYAYVDGQPGSTFCVNATNSCASCSVNGGFTPFGSVGDGQYVCVRHISSPLPNRITSTTLHIGPQAGEFRVSTGNLLAGCSLDVDGNGSIDALTDGIILIRAMFGLTGTAATNGAIGAGATRGDWAALRGFLNGNCGASFAP